MRKLLISLIFTSILFSLVVTPVGAIPMPVNATPSGLPKAKQQVQEKQQNLQQRKENVASRVAEKRENIASRVAEKKSELWKRHTERIKEWMRRIVKRMQAHIDRFGKLITRVETRRDKLQALGKDVTKLNAWIAKAKQNRDAAQVAVNNAQTAVEAIDPNAVDPKPAIEKARNAIHTARQALVTMWTTMKQVVVELKAQGLTGAGTATPSAKLKEATGSGI